MKTVENGKKATPRKSVDTGPATATEQHSAVDDTNNGVPNRERSLFDGLRQADRETVSRRSLFEALQAAGLRKDDPRLSQSIERLRANPTDELTYETFAAAIRPNILIIDQALTGRLVIPEFREFSESLTKIFAVARKCSDGAVADYIPQLSRVDPELFGLGLCTVSGQRFALGDSGKVFCAQSCCKPLNYCLALEELGESRVHEHVGREPSGQSFNELTLNRAGRPHNPMINAGAIMCSALIRPELTAADRFDFVLDTWAAACGGVRPGFSNPAYLSERATADRNFALGYFMRENGAFPADTDLVETLEFYFQCCSLEVTVESMAVLAATLANGGICPTTGERVLSPSTAQRCLSLMSSCGLYDFSGEWAFSIGLPAKSGVAGAILVVVPNVLGLCVWSPRLDECGNSVRGIKFCRDLVGAFNFHNYDSLFGDLQGKKDPRRGQRRANSDAIVELCWAASQGDLTGVRRLAARGVDLGAADYDGRTALHLAASEGQTAVVEYLVSRDVGVSAKDRWNNTPLDDAVRGAHDRIVELLSERAGDRGQDQDAR